MARRKIIAGNWKMNKTPAEAKTLIEDMKQQLDKDVYKYCELVLCVPFTDLQSAIKAARGSKISIGAQNKHFEKSGAFTGEISADMLKEMGVKYVIIGHSERRQYFNETDIDCNKKIKVAIAAGIRPILCCGESLEEREQNVTMEVVRKQIKIALRDVPAEDIKKVVIAYEPIWAIGTGKTASADQAEEMCKTIRETVKDLYNEETAENVRIQYGGSVKPANVKELMSKPDIDGGLVGGASLDPESFLALVNYQD